MTIVVDGEQMSIDRVIAYLYKLVNVIQVEDLTSQPMVSRDLAMVKVRTTSENRAEIIQMVEVFRAHVVDVTPNSLIVEITGDEEKINGFVEVLRPLGIIEMVRTGSVAMGRGNAALMSTNGNGKLYGSVAVA
jgi:acetolactate synthase-1/3 small subunit